MPQIIALAGLLPVSNKLTNQELSGKSSIELREELPIIRLAFSLFDSIFQQ